MAVDLDEIARLKSAVGRRARAEMARVLAANWHGDAIRLRNAQQVVNGARDNLLSMLSDAEAAPPDELLAAEAHDAIAEGICASVRAILESKANMDNLFAKSEATRDAFDENTKELKELSKPIDDLIAQKTKDKLKSEIIAQSKAFANFVKNLTKDPYTFYPIAQEFLSGRIGQALPHVLTRRFPRFQGSTDMMEYLKARGMTAGDFAKYNKWWGRAMKFVGAVGAGIWITMTVCEAIADEGHWAYHVTQAATALGAGIALNAVITGSAVASAISSTFALAGVTAEVPPVAAALAAAGIVIAAGVAVAKLFESLISLLFGSMKTRQSMSISLSRGMVASLDAKLSKSMSVSLMPS